MRTPEAPTNRREATSPWWARLFGKGQNRAEREASPPFDPEELDRAMARARSQDGETLGSLSEARPLLVVLLRHLGCAFCTETLADLARARGSVEGSGAGIVLVHLARDDQRAERLFSIYKLADVPRISDPDKHLYSALGLEKGSMAELFGPRVAARTVAAGCRGHFHGRGEGDWAQMPGVFVIHRGTVVRAFSYKTIADRPDFEELVSGIAIEAAQ